jgi:hypothetical protein
MKLTVKKIDKNEIRKGIVRINEKDRTINNKFIKSSTLIIIKKGNNQIRRIVYGIENDEQNIIKMDEDTRNILELENEKEYTFEIDVCDEQPKKIINEIIYFWNHPEIIINFPVKIAVISMVISIVSIIISIISLAITILN